MCVPYESIEMVINDRSFAMINLKQTHFGASKFIRFLWYKKKMQHKATDYVYCENFFFLLLNMLFLKYVQLYDMLRIEWANEQNNVTLN